MYFLQTTVTIEDKVFEIRNKGDFRMVLDCFEALTDTELTEDERVYSAVIIFYEGFNDTDDIITHRDIFPQLQKEMMKFLDGGEENIVSNTHGHKVLDWKQDSNLICSAVNGVAKQEIRALDYLHWWTFLSYYQAIGECPLTHIVGIRYKIANGEKLEKYEKKFINENPQYFTRDYRSVEQQEADEYIRRLWGE